LFAFRPNIQYNSNTMFQQNPPLQKPKTILTNKRGELIHNNLLSLICENFSRIKNYATCETRINEEFNLISCPVIMKKGCTYVIKTCKPIQYIHIAILFMEGRKIYFPWKSNF